MKLLLKDARGPVARILNMEPSDTRVIEYINEAIELMTVSNDWADMRKIMSFVAYNGFITFPPEVIVPLKFTVGEQIGQPYGRHYEYLMTGPGKGEDWLMTAKNLVDVGEFPSTYDIAPDDPKKLILWSDRAETYPFSVLIRGLDETGHEVRSEDGSIGETVTWTNIAGTDGIAVPATVMKSTTNTFSKIIQITKSESNGYLSVSTDDGNGIPENVISHYHPRETTPSYRRFALHGSVNKDSDGYTLVKGLFRVQALPVRDEDDPLAVNMITAIKLAVKAIIHDENEEPNKAAINEGKVERILMNQINQYEVDDNLVDADDGYGNGDVEM